MAAEEAARKSRLPQDEAHELRLKFMHVFEADKLAARLDRLVAGEATPSYLLGGATAAARVAEVLGRDLRLVVTLREPVARLYSHYQMTADLDCSAGQRERRGTVAGKPCAQLVEEDLQALAKVGITHGRDPRSLSEAELERFDTDYLAPTMATGHGSHSYVGRGLYYLQLKLWLRSFPRDNLLARASTRSQRTRRRPWTRSSSTSDSRRTRCRTSLRATRATTRPCRNNCASRWQTFSRRTTRRSRKLLGADFTFTSTAALPTQAMPPPAKEQ